MYYMDLKYKSLCILEYVFMLLNEFGLPPLYLYFTLYRREG